MSETTNPNLSSVAKTLLITLYIRAIESQRPDALVKDERAEALVRQLDQESLQKTLALTDDFSRVAVILKGREFDRFAQDFLRRHPDAVVVHIGCGLDTRFERVAERNSRVEWYDLDLPEVIELRRNLVGGEGARHHFLAGSVLDSAWLDAVSTHHQRPFLFLAEGVFMYLKEAQVKSLVLTLRDQFPGAELVFDAFSPIMRWGHNIRVTRTGIGAHLHWALKHGQDLERWSDGIRLLDERFPFQYPEPRMRRALQMRLFPFLATAIGVFHYQLKEDGMSETLRMGRSVEQDLSGVSETLLITLYLRAMESQRPDALIKDEKAEALVKKISDDGLYDFSRVKSLRLSEANKLVIILRNREFDRYVRDFLARHPQAVVVHIGCGLDSRFERVDNSQVEWYALDLPDVIDLRRKLIGGEGERYHLLGCSVLDNAWLEAVSAHRQRPFLFLAEGVFMYFKGAQVKSLVRTLRDRFPGAELAFDAYSPIHVWRHNLQTSTSKINLRVHWGIWHGQEIEGWGDGIRLLDEWGFFDDPTPRLAHIGWLRPIESLARTLRIYHFQLGKAAG